MLPLHYLHRRAFAHSYRIQVSVFVLWEVENGIRPHFNTLTNMSSKKDMRRADLGRSIRQPFQQKLTIPVIPYAAPKDEKPSDFSSTLTSTMPMAAVSDIPPSGCGKR